MPSSESDAQRPDPDSDPASARDSASRAKTCARPRIALLADGTTASRYVRDLAETFADDNDVDLVALIIQDVPQPREGRFKRLGRLFRKHGLAGTLSIIAFSIIVRLEQRILRRSGRHRDHLGTFDVSGFARTQLVVRPAVSKSGFVYRFSEEDVAAVRALDLDVIVRCGNGILKGDILRAAKKGVLSLHHGDNRINRGGPAGFWEVYERQAQTGFVVQRLNEELDGGQILFRGAISTENLFLRNQANLYARSNIYLARTIKAVCRGEERVEEPHIYDHQLYRTPSLAKTLRYAFRTWTRILRLRLSAAAGYSSRWGVSYLRGDWRSAVLWRARRIPNPAGHFLADPFAVAIDGRDYVLVEDFVHAKNKGLISAYEIREDGAAERIGVALEEPFHLSFPFLFRYDGILYMVPETMGARQIRLYRCQGDPTRWTLEKVLIDDVDAVDTMIFEKNGAWWMLTTINQGQCGANDAELHLFRADTPLGPWEAFSNGPLFVDSSRGRNGGLLSDGTHLYRVAQRQGFSEYGIGVTLYRIEISDSGYSEHFVQQLSPHFATGMQGMHHFHNCGSLLVFDHREPGRISSESR